MLNTTAKRTLQWTFPPPLNLEQWASWKRGSEENTSLPPFHFLPNFQYSLYQFLFFQMPSDFRTTLFIHSTYMESNNRTREMIKVHEEESWVRGWKMSRDTNFRRLLNFKLFFTLPNRICKMSTATVCHRLITISFSLIFRRVGGGGDYSSRIYHFVFTLLTEHFDPGFFF